MNTEQINDCIKRFSLMSREELIEYYKNMYDPNKELSEDEKEELMYLTAHITRPWVDNVLTPVIEKMCYDRKEKELLYE